MHKFKPEATEEQRAEILAMIENLGEACGGKEAGILYWCAGPNLDKRKGFDIVEVAMFENWDAKERFRVCPGHSAFVAKLREAADWVVGNIVGPTPVVDLPS
jgi:hypothetical protein